jgi:5-formyltetrahydrofolate cyclo-ligase
MIKKELRKLYKNKRNSLGTAQVNEFSEQILKNLHKEIDLRAKVVSIFAPIDRFSEINTYPLLIENKSTFVLPVMKGNDLVHVKFEGLEQLKVTDWGIPEPAYGEELKPCEIDVVIVPMLVFDVKGYRVGYGKGFYDQFLVQCKKDTKFIGLSIFEPIDKIDDLHAGDIPLHQVITPKLVYKF